jgi:arylsulfatase A-like enzyme
MNTTARTVALGLWAVLALGSDWSFAADGKKPNIVVIVGDDMGYADIGVHGCKDIPTPNLDALAAAGVRCTQGYVSGPYCSPTRAGLLTGRYQTRFGHEFNAGRGNTGLPVAETTLADRLKTAGYATGLVGKWHLGSADRFHPQERGFDEFFGFLGGAHSYFPATGDGVLRGKLPANEKEYLTDAFAREAVAFIERHQDQPFFLYLAFNAVHTPMHATDARLERFQDIPDRQRRTYAAMMFAMDEAIGKVLDALRQAELEKDTLVFFISDNGGPTMQGTTINASSNAPLRGSKRTTLEGGIRVPFLVKWPSQLPAGAVYEKPVIQLDILPTALAAVGIEPQPDWQLEGVDLLPYLRGQSKDKPHETLYWRFGQQMAIRQGDWKLVRYDPVVDDARGQATPPRLYNLADNIGESQDLSQQHPEKVRELQAAWDQWNQSNISPLWGGGRKRK